MKRPPFKLDGRHGTIRSRAADGKAYLHTGRLTFVWDAWLQGVLAGTVECVGEFSLGGVPRGRRVWHRIEATPDEARETFLTYRLGGRMRIRRCERIRASRKRRGLPVTNPEGAPDADE